MLVRNGYVQEVPVQNASHHHEKGSGDQDRAVILAGSLPEVEFIENISASSFYPPIQVSLDYPQYAAGEGDFGEALRTEHIITQQR